MMASPQFWMIFALICAFAASSRSRFRCACGCGCRCCDDCTCGCSWGCRHGSGSSALLLLLLYALIAGRFRGGSVSVALSFLVTWIFLREIFKTRCRMKREGTDDPELEDAAEEDE